jgi:hypothetical protein
MAASRCTKEIDGPKIDGRGNVAWRRRCQNKTTDQSGRCRFHRNWDTVGGSCFVGERAQDHLRHLVQAAAS